MNTVKPMYEWNKIPWRKLERVVFKLQKRIYQAANRGDVKALRRLQKLLMKSWAAKCLAVRRVTQDNQGRKTAGVDGLVRFVGYKPILPRIRGISRKEKNLDNLIVMRVIVSNLES